jgi:hypothetical protein
MSLRAGDFTRYSTGQRSRTLSVSTNCWDSRSSTPDRARHPWAGRDCAVEEANRRPELSGSRIWRPWTRAPRTGPNPGLSLAERRFSRTRVSRDGRLAPVDVASPKGILSLAFRLQFRQQLLDAVLFLERRQTVFHVVGGDPGLGLAGRLSVGHLVLHAIESLGTRTIP